MTDAEERVFTYRRGLKVFHPAGRDELLSEPGRDEVAARSRA